MKKELLIGITASVIGGIILMIIEPSRHSIVIGMSKAWKYIKTFFIFVWSFLTTTHEINGLIIILSGLLWIFFIIIILSVIKDNVFRKSDRIYTTYTEDTFYGMKWRWYWEDAKIKNLWCFCPECEYELSYQEESSYRHRIYNAPNLILICDHCSKEHPFQDYDKDHLLSIIEREIWRKIRIGEKPDKQESLNTQP